MRCLGRRAPPHGQAAPQGARTHRPPCHASARHIERTSRTDGPGLGLSGISPEAASTVVVPDAVLVFSDGVVGAGWVALRYDAPSQDFEVRSLSAIVGAEVLGLDLS